MGEFTYKSGDLIRITFNPYQNQWIEYFNTNMKKSCRIQFPEKDENYEYYPYIYLHKSNKCELIMDYVIKNIEKFADRKYYQP